MLNPRDHKHLFRYTLKGLDELEHFPDEASKQKALEETSSEVGARDLAIGIFFIASAGIGSMWLAKTIVRHLPFAMPRFVGESIPFIVMFTAVGFTLVFLHRWGTRDTLRKKLLHAGVPVCMKCGYLLRGLDRETPTCPECGRRIDENAKAILIKEQAAQLEVPHRP